MTLAAPARHAYRSAARRARFLLASFVILTIAVMVPPVRTGALRTLGEWLVVSDPLEPADIAVLTENVDGGALEIGDLYAAHVMPRVMLLNREPTDVDRELTRRGVRVEDPTLTALVQLGVPREAIVTVTAGEGGTTDGTDGLSTWAAGHPRFRVLVLVNTSHARRYRRTLRRLWPGHVPLPSVRYPRANLFHADDWWRARTQRREGLFELQKLVWDYLTHPL